MTPQLSLLGTPRLERRGRPVAFDTSEALGLLAYLAVAGGPHPPEVLTELLWPDAGREEATTALRRTLADIRRAAGVSLVQDDGGALTLDPDVAVVDVMRVRALRAGLTTHDHAPTTICDRCVAPLVEIADLHRGPFLAGYALPGRDRFDTWRASAVEQAQRELGGVLARLVDAHLHTGDLESATRAAIRRLTLEPLHEPTHRALMRLYAWQGRREDALDQYRSCVRTLWSDLGVTPLEDTIRLSEEVLAGAFPPPGEPLFGPPDPLRGTASGGAAWRPPLVARERELAMLSTAIERVHTDGVVIVIEGEVGSGRTRLLEELRAHPKVGDRRVLSTTSRRDGTGRAYGVVIELLRSAVGPTPATSGWLAELRTDVAREIGRLLPEVAEAVGPPLPVDGAGATCRLTDALVTALAAAASDGPQPPGMLMVDDVQWIDESSLDVLSQLAQRLAGCPVCVVLAWPTELVGRGHRLRRLVADLARRQLVRQLPLGRLDATAVRCLFDDALGEGHPSAGATTEQIIDATEGVPLLVVEYLAALTRDPVSLQDPPKGPEDLLSARLDAVDPAARQVLTAAAVIGHRFDAALIRDASGRAEEEAVQALAELTAGGLLTGPGRGRTGYDIPHTHLRALVYGQAAPLRRRLLHRRVAAALERRTRHADQDGSLAAVIAAHHAAAGDGAVAATWSDRAAASAAELLAIPEAIRHYEEALAYGHPDPARLHERLGDLHVLGGRHCAAHRHYDAAAALAGGRRLAAVEHKIAGVYQRWGRWTLADEHLRRALAAVEDGTGSSTLALRARILTDRGLVAHRQGHDTDAMSLARAALRAASETPDLGARAGAHNLLGVLCRDDLSAAREHLGQALDLARRHQQPSIEIAAANNLAQASAAAGDVDRALSLAESALARVGQLADRHREAVLRNNLADLLRAAGRNEEAMLHLKRAVTLFAEIGEPDAHAPEIWQLAVW